MRRRRGHSLQHPLQNLPPLGPGAMPRIGVDVSRPRHAHQLAAPGVGVLLHQIERAVGIVVAAHHHARVGQHRARHRGKALQRRHAQRIGRRHQQRRLHPRRHGSRQMHGSDAPQTVCHQHHRTGPRRDRARQLRHPRSALRRLPVLLLHPLGLRQPLLPARLPVRRPRVVPARHHHNAHRSSMAGVNKRKSGVHDGFS